MSLFELQESTDVVSLGESSDGSHDISGFSDFDIENTVFALCRGDWPEAVVESRVNVALYMAADYVEELLDFDINRMSGIEYNKAWMHSVIRSYAHNISSQAS